MAVKKATAVKKPKEKKAVKEIPSDFAVKLGETKGKLDALDDRVKHNCDSAEKNFKSLDGKIGDLDKKMDGKLGDLDKKLDAKMDSLDTKFDNLNASIISTMSSQNGRIDANEQRIKDQGELTHKLSAAVTKRSAALWFIFAWMVFSFVFGRAYDWDWIKSFFHKTTVQERAEMVKSGAETVKDIIK
ncbi:hypothetical protein J6U78_03935 [bacterium]|nr:hypothetical protein [bacterium]